MSRIAAAEQMVEPCLRRPEASSSQHCPHRCRSRSNSRALADKPDALDCSQPSFKTPTTRGPDLLRVRVVRLQVLAFSFSEWTLCSTVSDAATVHQARAARSEHSRRRPALSVHDLVPGEARLTIVD